MIKPKADKLFEVSYEVCNKVGGIYTVLSSKAAVMMERYNDYTAIGPYYPEKADIAMEQMPAPDEYTDIFDALRNEGVECIYGEWLIEGRPKVILIDFKKCMDWQDGIKKELWDNFGVDTLFAAWDYTEPMIWAWCVGKLLQKIGEKFGSRKIVGHYHEWLAGIALLYLKLNNSNVRSVFTTHATMLGRAISGSGEDLYAMLEGIDAPAMAKKYRVVDKYTTEKACAQNCDVFTTVSETTGYEAEKILEKKPGVLVLNGLDIQKFPTFEETSVKHQGTREVIRDFLSYYFNPYYNIDLEQSLNFMIIGRPEFRNKGIDIYIKALGELNRRMKKEESKKTIFSFFFVPNATHGIRTSVLQNKNIFQEIKKDVENQNDTVKTRLIRDLASGEVPKIDSLLSKNFLLSIKKHVQSFLKQGDVPPFSTHNLVADGNDTIIQAFKSEGLLNLEEDKVKVIYYPTYIAESDGILNLKYYEAISGCHLGVFPSYYEPWGYTPLECSALGVPAITTDFAGFGRFIKKVSKEKGKGIYVLERFQKDEGEVIHEFAEILHTFASMNKTQRVNQKIAAKELSLLADWTILVNNYIEAHNKAIDSGG
ncbi:glycosyltransferase [Candidatus Woesearchaeota archaeon]|nr:glycosyltransferase [Candidatus Woesearchaeota archaeon]